MRNVSGIFAPVTKARYTFVTKPKKSILTAFNLFLFFSKGIPFKIQSISTTGGSIRIQISPPLDRGGHPSLTYDIAYRQSGIGGPGLGYGKLNVFISLLPVEGTKKLTL